MEIRSREMYGKYPDYDHDSNLIMIENLINTSTVSPSVPGISRSFNKKFPSGSLDVASARLIPFLRTTTKGSGFSVD